MVDTSLYIHVPFCIHRCGYCDFNTYAGLQRLIPAYSGSVCRELEFLRGSSTEEISIKTIYFGGGTPSLLSTQDIDKILKAIRRCFSVDEGVEISLEANPGTINENQLQELHDRGITRISLGMQSADPAELIMLERQHSFDDVIQAVVWLKQAKIDNFNLDLIYGLPKQSVKTWLSTLNAALQLTPDHLSLYALTLEHGTPMQHKVTEGILPVPDPDLAADMYELAQEALSDAGYIQYEISNWAKVDESGTLKSCRHNLQYWRNLPYLGIGAGAHGYFNHHRSVDVATPGAYIQRMKNNEIQVRYQDAPATPATIQLTEVDRDAEISETMMMGLRLVVEGVSNNSFYQRFGITLQDRFATQIDRFLSIGLLEWGGEQKDQLRLTKKGYLIGNQVFVEFI
jgi:oxygen-independent coproporphyrinogen-3 oxidase